MTAPEPYGVAGRKGRTIIHDHGHRRHVGLTAWDKDGTQLIDVYSLADGKTPHLVTIRLADLIQGITQETT